MTATDSPPVIRQWARDNGFSVGDRGRLSPDVLTAYAGREADVGGSAKAVLAADLPDVPQRFAAGRLQLAVRPKPGATGISRRVRARAS